MNGVTHYTVGTAVALLTTDALIQANNWLVSTLPQPIAGLFTPPQSLLQANAAANALHNLASMASNATASGLADPTAIASNTDVSSLLQASGIVVQDISTLVVNWLIIAAIGALSGLLPDIDHGGSTISTLGNHIEKFVFKLFRPHGIIKLLVFLLCQLLNLITQVTSAIAQLCGGHRGPIHTATVMLLFSTAVGLFTGNVWAIPFYGLIFGIGYLSHLIIDSPNPTGIMWLWPISKKYYNLGIPKHLQFHSSSALANLLIGGTAVAGIGLQVWWLTDSSIWTIAVLIILGLMQVVSFSRNLKNQSGQPHQQQAWGGNSRY